MRRESNCPKLSPRLSLREGGRLATKAYKKTSKTSLKCAEDGSSHNFITIGSFLF